MEKNKSSRRRSTDLLIGSRAGKTENQSVRLDELQRKQRQLETVNEELRRNQAEMEAVQTRYFDFFNAAPVGFLTITSQGLIVEANLAVATLLEEEILSLIGQALVCYVIPRDQANCDFHFKQLFTTSEPSRFELRFLAKDGRQFWGRLEANLMRGNDASLCRVVLSDITERKKAEEALQASEAKYRQLFEMQSEALFLIDNQSGNILDANFAAVALYGYSRNELLAMKNSDLSAEPEETRSATARSAAKAGKEGQAGIPLRYHRKKDGTIFPVEITATAIMWKERPAHIPAIRDISERRQAEEKLAAERNLLLTLMNTIPDRIFVKDKECRFLLNNIAHVNALGAHSQAEVMGKNDYEFMPAPEASRYFAADQQVMEKDEPVYNIEEPTILPTGESGTLLVSKVPLHDTGCEVIGLIGISRDITKQKIAEEALRRSVAIQTALREIAEAAVSAASLKSLYALVHIAAGRVLATRNFYIALLDESTGQVVRPYCIDDMFFVPRQRPIGKGLTEYVMKRGKVLHATQTELDRLRETGEVSPLDAPAHEYLGAPLKDSTGKSFGVIAIVSEDKKQPFRPEDAEVLSIIAAQVSMAIESKQQGTTPQG